MLHVIVVYSKVLKFWMSVFDIVLITVMASIYNVQSIENLNNNNFHTWEMKMEHCMFMKKDKLADGTIILNILDSLLHHVAHVKLRTTFVQHLKENMLTIDCNYIKSFTNLKMEEGILVQVHISKVRMLVDQLASIDHPISIEDCAFTFLGSLWSFFHTLVVLYNNHTNELSMELVCGQILQKELWFKQELPNHGTK